MVCLILSLVAVATLTHTTDSLLPIITTLGGALAMYIPRRKEGSK
jgi:hypothetical protein